MISHFQLTPQKKESGKFGLLGLLAVRQRQFGAIRFQEKKNYHPTILNYPTSGCSPVKYCRLIAGFVDRNSLSACRTISKTLISPTGAKSTLPELAKTIRKAPVPPENSRGESEFPQPPLFPEYRRKREAKSEKKDKKNLISAPLPAARRIWCD